MGVGAPAWTADADAWLNAGMAADDPTGTDWTEREIDLVVADYAEMLAMELVGEPYVKAQRNAALQALTTRSKGSIEYKHQNISAVLAKLGLPWIPGYKPAGHYQRALLDGVERLLDARGNLLLDGIVQETVGLADDAALYFEPPPPLDEPEDGEPPALRRLVRKFDPAARDARNRALGRRGEERVLLSERAYLKAADRADLAHRVRWVAQEDGDGAGFDILSFEPDGRERLLEVKTTLGHRTTPFFLSANEFEMSHERPNEFRLVRLYDFARTPRAFELVPPLERSVVLRTASYRASFGA